MFNLILLVVEPSKANFWPYVNWSLKKNLIDFEVENSNFVY
jgi:hypothetical protein